MQSGRFRLSSKQKVHIYLNSAGKGGLSSKKIIFLRLCWFQFGLKIKRGPGPLDPSLKILPMVYSGRLWFRPSGDRVLPLSMRYASLDLRRDMLRVGCNSSEISSMSTIEWPG